MKKLVVLCIMDGWGLTTLTPGNAVALANTPVYDQIIQKYPFTTLKAAEEAVGLPVGQMGNSEVGHMNLGAGRIVYTGLSLINKEIDDKLFPNNPALQKLFEQIKKQNGKLHLMGLVSYGGIHSHFNHLKAIANAAFNHQIPYIVHAFTDGRDVSPFAAENDFKDLQKLMDQTNGQWGLIAGRYYAMDRDQRWDRTEKVYQAMVKNECDHRYDEPIEYIKASYLNKITDEFILPALPKDFANKTIEKNDVVLFFNFRPDRARQLCHLLKPSTQLYDYEPSNKRVDNLYLVTLMDYPKTNVDLVLYPPFEIQKTLGEVLDENQIKQLRIAETEKYAHVTYFFDGGKEIEWKHGSKLLIPSPKVATYDLQPEMSAEKITEQLLPQLSQYEVIILNFANPDMVGHTGVISATIKAVETVDKQVGIILKAVKSLKGSMLVIADHGNAEVKLDKDLLPATSHTTNPVPCVLIGAEQYTLRNNGVLGDIAPTILELLNIPQPKEMTGKSLLIKKG